MAKTKKKRVTKKKTEAETVISPPTATPDDSTQDVINQRVIDNNANESDFPPISNEYLNTPLGTPVETAPVAPIETTVSTSRTKLENRLDKFADEYPMTWKFCDAGGVDGYEIMYKLTGQKTWVTANETFVDFEHSVERYLRIQRASAFGVKRA